MLKKLITSIEVSDLKIAERMTVYEASFVFDAAKKPDYDYFLDIYLHTSSRDTVSITLENESDDIFSIKALDGEKIDYDKFFENLYEGDTVKTKVRIQKSIKDNYISVYCFDAFVKDILSLSLDECMKAFANLFKDSPQYLVFDLYDGNAHFSTKTMFFVAHGNRIENIAFKREKRIADCKEIAYFYNFDVYELLPDDFKIEINYIGNPLNDVFQKIVSLLAISFIATTANFIGNEVKGVINGQRMVEYNCSIDGLEKNKILYRIYDWIYTDGNAIDKAIISRNIISLHCKQIPISELDEKVMYSIESSYNLYLRKNVEQYLELKNKVAEFINANVSKTGEYGMQLLEKFKANLIAIFGFLFSVILANLASSQPLDNIFTKDIVLIMRVVLAGSLIYFVICKRQLDYEIEKVSDSYGDLKNNYKDVLEEKELATIFEDDKLMNDMKKEMSAKRKMFERIWIISLIAIFVIVECRGADIAFKDILKFIGSIFVTRQ